VEALRKLGSFHFDGTAEELKLARSRVALKPIPQGLWQIARNLDAR
jgi:hypothetical protein